MSESKTHDYATRRGWGHDVVTHTISDKGMHVTASGWGEGIQQGDYLILPSHSASARYRVDRIKYERDPRDMWYAELSFAPRGEQEP